MSSEFIDTLFSNSWSVFLILLMFGGSIFVHELGHFLAARRRGLKIDRFSIGFGPKLMTWKRNGVEYCLSLLPFGGYVALPQLADMGAIEGEYEPTDDPLPPISFTDKFIVAVMGAVFNMIFAFLLASVLWMTGQPSSEQQQTTVIGHVSRTLQLDDNHAVDGPAFTAGLRPGDQVHAIDGRKVSTFSDLQHTLITGSGRDEDGRPLAEFTIIRDGEEMSLAVHPQLAEINRVSGERVRLIGMSPAHSLVVRSIMDHSPAASSGIKPGEQITAVDGRKLYSLATLIEYLEEKKDAPVAVTVTDGAISRDVTLKAELVPRTKPLARLKVIDGKRSGSLTVQPFFTGSEAGGSIDPEALATIEVHDIVDPTGFMFGDLALGDRVTAVNGRPIGNLAAWITAINHPGDRALSLTISRDEAVRAVPVMGSAVAELVPAVKTAMLGLEFASRRLIIHLNPIEQFSEIVRTTFQVLGSVASPKSDIGIRNLSGPPGIIRVIHQFSQIDIRLVIWFICLLNINLAILNLLPIPVLDGGHIVFAAIARLRGKALPPNLVAGTQGVFMILLFSLMIYVSFFDVRRWQGDNQAEDRDTLERSLYITPVFKSTPRSG